MHQIVWNDERVGYARIEKEGMCLKIHCSCTPPYKGMFRVRVSDDSNSRDLGICVPEGEYFTLSARVPLKYLQGDKLTFRLISAEKKAEILPVENGEPFSGLDRLENARLQFVDGQGQIVIDSIQDQPDNDQIPEFQ